jgi:uncharacterized lipoprotein YbaY
MKLSNKVIAIPAIAIAAGISLAACGSAKAPAAAPAVTHTGDRTGCCCEAQRHYSGA